MPARPVSRARCGTTSPTQPMMPLAATAAEVIKVAAAITTMRSMRVSTPRAVASSSPKVMTSMRQRSRASGTNPIATAGNRLVRSRRVGRRQAAEQPESDGRQLVVRVGEILSAARHPLRTARQ